MRAPICSLLGPICLLWVGCSIHAEGLFARDGGERIDAGVDGGMDECNVGETRICGATIGVCRAGTQACVGGRFSSECAGEIPPGAEECADGADGDCDGTVDEGCACSPGATMPCGSDVGTCVPGMQTCNADATWSACTGGVVPSMEVCDASMADENCDGAANEGCECVNGAEESCTVFGCGGRRTCVSGRWGGCTPDSVVGEECDGDDDDCDGVIDDSPADCGAATGCAVVRDPAQMDRPYLLCVQDRWSGAEAFCSDRGYHLATIDGDAENAFLLGATRADGRDTQWYIGYNDYDNDGTYGWTHGSSTYERWASTPPANKCAVLDVAAGDWGFMSCTGMAAYICEPGG